MGQSKAIGINSWDSLCVVVSQGDALRFETETRSLLTEEIIWFGSVDTKDWPVFLDVPPSSLRDNYPIRLPQKYF